MIKKNHPIFKRLFKSLYFKFFSLLFFFFPPLQLVIPLTTQDDLDKAVELLDRSVHMKSLKILLVLQVSSEVGHTAMTLMVVSDTCAHYVRCVAADTPAAFSVL